MPIEFALLKDEPFPIKQCPECGFNLSESSYHWARGSVQRCKRKWGFLWRQPYCACICHKCHNLVGWEEPPLDIGHIILVEVRKELRQQGVYAEWMKGMSHNQLEVVTESGWLCIDSRRHGRQHIIISYVYDTASLNVEIDPYDVNCAIKGMIPPRYNGDKWGGGHYFYLFDMAKNGAINDTVSVVRRIHKSRTNGILDRIKTFFMDLFNTDRI